MRREINWKRNKWLMGTVPPNKSVAGTKQTEILLFSKLLLLVCHGWMIISNLFLPVCQGSVPPCYTLCFTDCGEWGTCLDSVDILLLESQAWGQFCQTFYYYSDVALSDWEFHNPPAKLKWVPDITFFTKILFPI